ncbi:MAG: penicillin-binding protein 2 [Planctomycetota bacterium]
MRSRNQTTAIRLLCGSLIVALFALIGRLIYINERQGPTLLARADRQQRSFHPLKDRRGLIVDARGRMIAGTMLRKSIFADPKVIPDKEEAAQRLSEILGIDSAEIGPDLIAADDQRFFVIKRGVNDEQAELVKATGIHGLGTFDEPYRTYPMNSLAGALIGFVAADGHGVSGIEYQCESWLRGEAGLKTIIRDAGRKAFWLADGGYRPPRDGMHVVLTIDTEIQASVERELEACIEKYHAQSAVAIVMHPSTGAILAMANVPSFDPNNYQDSQPARYRNRAITDPYEPGSTYKPFIAAGALAENCVHLGETFNCENGSYAEGARVLHDHHPYGNLTFEEVLIKSSNIGMAKIGRKMGNQRLHKYVKAFGFGDKTGIDITGEDPGIVQPFNRWTSFTTSSIPMGQEIAVTPLQMARAFCVFANGGYLVQPFVIRAVLAPDGQLISDFSNPPNKGRVLPEKIVKAMKEKVLEPIIEVGTGKASRLAYYKVFGKTGTAQMARHGGGGYEKDAYVSSFIAAAPGDDPQLVVIVAVTRPKKSIGYYGGTVAAPVVKNILAHALAYLQIDPDKKPGPESSSVVAGPAAD